ncbi:MAG: phosphoglycerate mutase, partial [Nitrospinae bacterium CG11_big_fil_rev_8_21_14_0_20_56_8]
YGKTAGTVSGSLLFRGMARAAGMQVAEVPGATGFSDTDFKGKVEAALRELENRDVVFLHVAAGEDVSLKGLIDEKILVIEDIDREVVGPLAQEVELRGNVKLLVTSNHFCSAVKLKYGSEPVPFLVYPSRNPNGAGKRFGETLAGLAAQRVWEGPSMISEFLKDQL